MLLTTSDRLSLEIHPLSPFFINFLFHVVPPSGTQTPIRSQACIFQEIIRWKHTGVTLEETVDMWGLHQMMGGCFYYCLIVITQDRAFPLLWECREGKWSTQIPGECCVCGLVYVKTRKDIPGEEPGEQSEFSCRRNVSPSCRSRNAWAGTTVSLRSDPPSPTESDGQRNTMRVKKKVE